MFETQQEKTIVAAHGLSKKEIALLEKHGYEVREIELSEEAGLNQMRAYQNAKRQDDAQDHIRRCNNCASKHNNWQPEPTYLKPFNHVSPKRVCKTCFENPSVGIHGSTNANVL